MLPFAPSKEGVPKIETIKVLGAKRQYNLYNYYASSHGIFQ